MYFIGLLPALGSFQTFSLIVIKIFEEKIKILKKKNLIFSVFSVLVYNEVRGVVVYCISDTPVCVCVGTF